MHKLTIRGGFSPNLNFIIFVKNLYHNYYGEGRSGMKFPWLLIDVAGLLEWEQAKHELERYWEAIIIGLESDNEADIDLWCEDRARYSSLFTNTPQGKDVFESVMHTFESWYETGDILCSRYSTPLVDYYYLEFMKEEFHEQLEGICEDWCIHVIYDKPESTWRTICKNMWIITPSPLRIEPGKMLTMLKREEHK